MSRSELAPTAVQIQNAKRLMAQAQIRDIRLIQANARYSPSARKSPSGFDVDIRTNSHGTAEAGKLTVVINCGLKATRPRSRRTEIEVTATFRLTYAIPEDLKLRK